MKQEGLLEIPAERPRSHQLSPQTEMSNIRFMFHEMSCSYVNHQPASYYYKVKRAMDVALSLFFLLFVMSWLTPLLAILIKLSSRGPVFFVQKRTGYMGVEFKCFKFRTMFVNDDADLRQVSINDRRITKIGKFLRITHLDETPQFLNVLLGDMSIIGPRPHMLYHTHFYSEQIPYYNVRLEVLPGMTGMAQIKDYIGEISVDRELRKRIQWDIFYVKHRSIGLDIKILFRTAWCVVRKVYQLVSPKNK